MHAERFDGLVTFAGCDKSLPGMLMAAARINLPSVFLYGGSILPGQHKGQATRHRVGVRGGRRPRRGDDRRRRAAARSSGARARARAHAPACSPPTRWRRSREAMGMSLPGSSSPPALDRRRDDFAYASGQAVVRLLELGIRPRQIMTKEAFENAIAVVMALGGSTNAVLHLLAIATEARVELALDDFNARRRAGAPHRRHQAAREVPHGRRRPDRRGAGRDAPPARGRAPPRRLPHRHRQDHGREPGRRSTRRRPTATSSTRSPTPIHDDRRHRRAEGHARPQGRGGEGGRHRPPDLRGPGPRVRRRGRGHGRRPRRAHRGRRHRGHPLRGPQGRPRACGRCWPSPAP